MFPPGLAPPTDRARRLRAALAKGMVTAPGAFDCISARLVDVQGFEAVYVTGSGVSMSALGAPDVGLMSFSEILDRVKRIADVVSVPVIADADTGYGGPLNVIRTVREMERAGVSGIQLEDQAWPKKCGHEPGRKLVDIAEMTGRLKAAVDARADADTLIIARTDARSTEGLAAALDRAAAYREAGADVIFVESPESTAELAEVARAVTAPTLVNQVEGGRTPMLPGKQLAEMGFAIAIYPNALTRVMSRMGAALLEELQRTGSTDGFRDRMYDHGQLWSLFRNQDWYALEKRYTG